MKSDLLGKFLGHVCNPYDDPTGYQRIGLDWMEHATHMAMDAIPAFPAHLPALNGRGGYETPVQAHSLLPYMDSIP